MEMVDIINKTKDFELLCQEIKNNSLAKAVLLISKDSKYSFEFAEELAGAILNDGAVVDNENTKKIRANSHPDVKCYPQKDKLLVGDSEEIVLESYVKPIFAEKKIFIIKDIDNSMESAQNKLLKILEEPPKNVYMILTCSNSNLVLPTIKSRCNKYELSKLDESIIEKFMEGKDNAKLIVSLSEGHLGKAEELGNLSYLNKLYESVVSVFTKLSSSKEVLTFAKSIETYKDDFDLIIEILGLAIEDILKLKVGKSGELKLKDKKDQLFSVSDQYTVKAICEIQKLLNKAIKEKMYNVNQSLIIENLLLNILEVKFVCK